MKAQGIALRVLLDRCRGLNGGNRGGPAIHVEDASGHPAVTLSPPPRSHAWDPLWWLLLHTRGLKGHPRVPDRPRPKAGGWPCTRRNAQVAGPASWCRGPDDGLEPLDLAELCGLLVLSPVRLRGLGRADAVDPSLVPRILSPAVDQAAPLRLLVGSAAAVLGLELAPYRARPDSGWQTLTAVQGEFGLDTRMLDSAWVYRPVGCVIRERRLYDATGRALAVVGTVPTRGGRTKRLGCLGQRPAGLTRQGSGRTSGHPSGDRWPTKSLTNPSLASVQPANQAGYRAVRSLSRSLPSGAGVPGPGPGP